MAWNTSFKGDISRKELTGIWNSLGFLGCWSTCGDQRRVASTCRCLSITTGCSDGNSARIAVAGVDIDRSRCGLGSGRGRIHHDSLISRVLTASRVSS